jgi:hypothetical protein
LQLLSLRTLPSLVRLKGAISFDRHHFNSLKTLFISFFLTFLVMGGWSSAAQTQILAIEFNQSDQPGFDLWPGSFSGSSTSANFTTDSNFTSGSTSVAINTSTTFGTPGNRGSSNGNPVGYTFQNLYEDLLIATSPTGFLTLNFSGLNPSQRYELRLYAWDPGASDGSDKVWTVTGGIGQPVSASVNFQNPLVDNETFALVFEITTSDEHLGLVSIGDQRIYSVDK